MADRIEIQNNVQLDRLLMTNPDTEKDVRKLVGMVLREAEKEVESAAARAMKNGDYRNTALAVRRAIYKRVLGGNVNILSGRRGRVKSRSDVPASTRGRTDKTEAMAHYADRSFVLRWLDAGTTGRTVEYMNGHRMFRQNVSERPKNRYFRFPRSLGARGKVTATHFFGPAANAAIQKAADKLVVLLGQLLRISAK